MGIRLEVEPRRCLVDEPLRICVSGLTVGQAVTVRAQQRDDTGRGWRAHAEFEADGAGCVDLASQAPAAGTYAGADPMGLIWSLMLDAEEPNRATVLLRQAHAISVEFTAEVDGQPVASQEVERLYVADGVERISVRDDGLVGTLFVPPGPGPHPVVMTLSGSGGGLNEGSAALYAAHGYAGFALAYFNAGAGLPDELIEIPLEYFETGIRWLQRQPRLDAARIAVSGTSRGGELVLLLGATFPAIKAVVAYVPSGIVFGGIGRDNTRGLKAAWTYRGEAIGWLRPDPARLSPEPQRQPAGEAIRLTERFLRNMEDDDAVKRAEIPVERINGPVLLISGQDDAMWPSTRLAEIARRRLEQRDFRHPYRHLAYAGAGHMIGPPYEPSTILASRHPLTGENYAYGGTPSAYAAAREDSWRQILGMLAAVFSKPAGQ